MSAFPLQRQSWAAVTEPLKPPKPKIFTIWFFTGKVCPTLVRRISIIHTLNSVIPLYLELIFFSKHRSNACFSVSHKLGHYLSSLLRLKYMHLAVSGTWRLPIRFSREKKTRWKVMGKMRTWRSLERWVRSARHTLGGVMVVWWGPTHSAMSMEWGWTSWLVEEISPFGDATMIHICGLVAKKFWVGVGEKETERGRKGMGKLRHQDEVSIYHDQCFVQGTMGDAKSICNLHTEKI